MAALPDEQAFLRIRLQWLRTQEAGYVAPFGLKIADASEPGSAADDDWDDSSEYGGDDLDL